MWNAFDMCLIEVKKQKRLQGHHHKFECEHFSEPMIPLWCRNEYTSQFSFQVRGSAACVTTEKRNTIRIKEKKDGAENKHVQQPLSFNLPRCAFHEMEKDGWKRKAHKC